MKFKHVLSMQLLTVEEGDLQEECEGDEQSLETTSVEVPDEDLFFIDKPRSSGEHTQVGSFPSSFVLMSTTKNVIHVNYEMLSYFSGR